VGASEWPASAHGRTRAGAGPYLTRCSTMGPDAATRRRILVDNPAGLIFSEVKRGSFTDSFPLVTV